MDSTEPLPVEFAPQLVRLEKRADGSILLESPQPLLEHGPHVVAWLDHHAKVSAQRVFLAERDDAGAWRTLRYGDAAVAVNALSQALLDCGLNAGRPLLLLSGNGIDHALLCLAAMQVGIPVAPISPAYSLLSQDCAKVCAIARQLRPGAIYCASYAPFARAISAISRLGIHAPLIVSAHPETEAQVEVALVSELRATSVTSQVERARAEVGPDTIAKILFTSGSTGIPKGVLNTQRMLTANQQMIAQCWPFVEKGEPPVLLDWLPWNHTFGGNHNFYLVLRHGGTLYIDGGRPIPGPADSKGTIAETVRNLREISPSLYFNVPAGYAALLPYLESDAELRQRFFAKLQLLFYAAAALPQDLWERMERVAILATGRRPLFVSSWGSTETAPMATSVHYRIDRAGIIGLPAPGVQLKLVPSGGKLEMRVKGPNVTPGYDNRPDLTAAAFDDEGFYRTGDGGRLFDIEHPEQGLLFDGRVSEDFKLQSGTWVHVGAVRVGVLAALSPLFLDAVVTGHDRAAVALLAWPALTACRAAAGLSESASLATLLCNSGLRERIREGVRAYNQQTAAAGSSARISRVLLLGDPPSLDANEITDKGYINQRAVLERRAALVESLYAESPPDEIILI